MKKPILVMLICVTGSLFAQESMKSKLKFPLENYLKQEPLYRNCVISDVVITSICIIDEKEKAKTMYDFYHSYRLKQIGEISFIKGKADFIDQHCTENKELFKKYVAEINTTLAETVPIIDSIWLIEDKYKTMPATTSTAEYYLVSFNFIYTLNGSKVTEKSHRVIFTNSYDIIHHDFLNR